MAGNLNSAKYEGSRDYLVWEVLGSCSSWVCTKQQQALTSVCLAAHLSSSPGSCMPFGKLLSFLNFCKMKLIKLSNPLKILGLVPPTY